MTGATVRESVKVAGLVERTRGLSARSWARSSALGIPAGMTPYLLVSELFGNSLRHSGSGVPGETVTVTVTARDRRCPGGGHRPRGPGVPELRPAAEDAEDGRGLGLVAGLAARWGWRRRGARTVTWFELRYC